MIFTCKKTESETTQFFLLQGENEQLFFLEKSGERVDRDKAKDQPNQYTLKLIDL
jgi:hypothetical protein